MADLCHLQICSLDGRQLEISVSEDLLGSELEEMILSNWPKRPGSALKMIWKGKELVKTKVLREQGLQCDMQSVISCINVPVNLWAAVLRVSDGEGPEGQGEESDLTEVRSLHLLGHSNIDISSSFQFLRMLQHLTLPDSFNQTLDVNLPSLQSLKFGYNFNHKVPGVHFPSLEKLIFGGSFNQSLNGVEFPKLQELSFGRAFRQLAQTTLPCSLRVLSLERSWKQSLAGLQLPELQELICSRYVTELPRSLEESLPSLLRLTFADFFNEDLSEMILPANLQSLTFGYAFNQSLKTLSLPSKLESLTFGAFYNQSLEGVYFPTTLQELIFGFYFNQSLITTILPSNLQSLVLGLDFNQPLDQVHLPDLKELVFGNYFNQPLKLVQLPSTLEILTFGRSFLACIAGVKLESFTKLHTLKLIETFNKPLNHFQLQSLKTLKTLSFGHSFNQSMELVKFPGQLNSLSFGNAFNQSLSDVQLPETLVSLSLGSAFNQTLEDVTFPKALESLSLGFGFNQSMQKTQLPELRSLKMGGLFGKRMPQLPSTLQHLVVKGHLQLPDFDSEITKLTSLESLTLGMGASKSASLVSKKNKVRGCDSLVLMED